MSVLIDGIQNLNLVPCHVDRDARLETVCEPEKNFFLIVLFLFTPSCKWFLTKKPLKDERANKSRFTGYVSALSESR